MRRVVRILNQVGGVSQSQALVLLRVLRHLLEVCPLVILHIHGCRGIEITGNRIDTAGHQQAVSCPVQLVGKVTYGTVWYHRGCGQLCLIAGNLVSLQSLVLVANPVSAALIRDVTPGVVLLDDSKVIYVRAVADILGDRAKVTSLGDSIKLKGKAEGFEILTLDELVR